MRKQTKRSLALTEDKFKRKLGVRPSTYEQMKAVLERREAGKKRSGRPPALCLDDQLILTLSFWREYRTQFHLAEDWEVDESTVRRTVERVENALIKSGQFSLPGRKALRDSHDIEVVVVDVAESPIERPKKSSNVTTRVRKSGTTTKAKSL